MTPTSGDADQSNGKEQPVGKEVCRNCLRRGHWVRNCKKFHLAGVAGLTGLKVHEDCEHCAEKTNGNFVPPPCGHCLPSLSTGEEGRCGSLHVLGGRVGARYIFNNYSDRTPGCVTSMLADLK